MIKKVTKKSEKQIEQFEQFDRASRERAGNNPLLSPNPIGFVMIVLTKFEGDPATACDHVDWHQRSAEHLDYHSQQSPPRNSSTSMLQFKRAFQNVKVRRYTFFSQGSESTVPNTVPFQRRRKKSKFENDTKWECECKKGETLQIIAIKRTLNCPLVKITLQEH